MLSLSAATRAVLPGRPWDGLPIRDVLSDLIGQQVVDRFYEVYRTGTPVTAQEWRVHLERPGGSVHEMFVNFTITRWLSPAGQVQGVTGVGFDVTELVRQRQAATLAQQRYEETRAVINSLQRALLPTGLPVLPGLQVAAGYLLADADTSAGGDWFDAVAQRDGRVALIVGDVVGHGVAASGVMGQLRAVLRDRLDDGAGIIEALAAADRFATRSPGAHATTICLAELDPVSGELTYCTAGHPPPLVVSPSGKTRFLSGTGGRPLATGGSFPIATARLAPGEVLLLYTDGIVERPGRDHVTGAQELAAVAADCATGRALREPSSSGTTARLWHTLVRPARLLDTTYPDISDSSSLSVFRIVEEPGGDETRVRIEGAVDAVTAGQTRTELLRRSRGGTVAMTVDLSGVTHLASAGVSVLHQLSDRHDEQKAPLALHAADGSPVRVILELVGLSTGRSELSAGLSSIAG